jgi:hypothetical protein
MPSLTIGPKNLTRSQPPPRRGLARTSQPGKLRIQDRDRFGGGFQRRNGTRDGFQRSVPLGAPASAVAAVGSSAARSNAAQILGGLVEQAVGVVGHGVSRHHHSSLQPRPLSSPKCKVGADSIDEKVMVPVARLVVALEPMVRIRRDKNPDPVAWRRLAGKKRRPVAGSRAMNAKPILYSASSSFRSCPQLSMESTERIIFEVGDDQIAINWTAKIERLPPAGRSRTEATELGPLISGGALNAGERE